MPKSKGSPAVQVTTTNSVASFFDDLPSPVRDACSRKHHAHRGELLVRTEAFWTQHGASVLKDLEDKRQELEDEGRTLGKDLLKGWPKIGRQFLKAVDTTLAKIPDALACGGIINQAQDDAELLLEITRYPQGLEALQDAGGAGLFAKGTPLRRDVAKWVKDHGSVIDSFIQDPLASPAYSTIGVKDRSYNTTLAPMDDPALMSTMDAPWNRPEWYAGTTSPWLGSISVEARGCLHHLLVHAWRTRLLDHSLLKRVREYQRHQAAHPWTAAHVLNHLYGPRGNSIDSSPRPDATLDAVLRWFAAMEEPFRIWLDETGLTADQTGILDDLRRLDVQGFAAFRRNGEMPRTLLPFAVITRFCLERLPQAGNTPLPSVDVETQTAKPLRAKRPQLERGRVTAAEAATKYQVPRSTLHHWLVKNPGLKRERDAATSVTTLDEQALINLLVQKGRR